MATRAHMTLLARGVGDDGEEGAHQSEQSEQPVKRKKREDISRQLAADLVAEMPVGARALPHVPSPLSPRLTRMRLQDWGTLTPRRLQRLGYYLHTLREPVPGEPVESLEAAARAAEADGAAQSSQKTIWNLEQLMDARIANDRQSINLLLVAYLVERWGSSLAECWAFMTAEEGRIKETVTPTVTVDAREQAAARDLGELYLRLLQRSPANARALLKVAEGLLNDTP